MNPILGLCLKFFTFLACISALIAKKLSDAEADRVFKRNQKTSNEWTLLNNLTWSQEGNDFSFVVFGGYTLISGILFLSRIIQTRAHQRLAENLLLLFGIFFFLLEGCLVFASVEHIPGQIEKNAYILGGLSFLVAVLMLIDLCFWSNQSNSVNSTTQTMLPYIYHLPYREKTHLELVEDVTEHQELSNNNSIYKRTDAVATADTRIPINTNLSEEKSQSQDVMFAKNIKKKNCKCAPLSPAEANSKVLSLNVKTKKYFNTPV